MARGKRRHAPTWLQGNYQEQVFRELVEDRNWIAFKQEGLPFPLLMSFGKAADGRLICTGLVAGALADEPVEVTARSLRELPIADLLGSVVALKDDDDFGGIFRAVLDLADEVEELPRRRPGPRGYDRHHFEHVAAIYREALTTSPRAPMREATRRLHTSEATARRWVQRARDMGLLGESQAGKAGERPQRKEEE